MTLKDKEVLVIGDARFNDAVKSRLNLNFIISE